MHSDMRGCGPIVAQLCGKSPDSLQRESNARVRILHIILPVCVLRVSYFIKKRGWHENESDGTRHKQRRARYITGRGINLRPPEGGGARLREGSRESLRVGATSRFALPPAHATDDDYGLGPKERREQRMNECPRGQRSNGMHASASGG